MPSRLRLSRIAQTSVLPLRVDWKTKYLPSGVQLPQHSAGGRFQPGRKGWGVFPSADISQIEDKPVSLSVRLSRRRPPSGDQRGHHSAPGRLTSFLSSVPSLFTQYRSPPLTYAISRPSGDQVAS